MMVKPNEATMTDNERAAELHALFDDLLSRGQRPTWITGRDIVGQACVRLAWADIELLRTRCKPLDMSATHVSSTGKTITIECDDHDTKDAILNVLTQ